MRFREMLDRCYIRSPVDGGKKRLLKLVKGRSVRKSDGFAWPPNLEIWVGRRIMLRDATPFLLLWDKSMASLLHRLGYRAIIRLEDHRWREVLEGVLGVKFKHLIHVFHLKQPESWYEQHFHVFDYARRAYAEELIWTEDDVLVELAYKEGLISWREGLIKTETGERKYEHYGLVALIEKCGSAFMRRAFNKLREEFGLGR